MTRPVLPATRIFFRLAGFFTVAAWSQLFLFPADTDRFFAWTIAPSLSAAFMGAGFGAGTALVLGMWRTDSWAAMRLSFLAVYAFSWVTLAATLMDLDRFHFGSGGAAEAAAWVWLAVYVVFPVVMTVLLVRQRGVVGADPVTAAALPTPVRWLVGCVGAATVGVGVALFIWPEDVAGAWPWAVSPLVARALSAWLIGLGLAALLAIRERDVERLRTPGVAYVVVGVLLLVALLRFEDQVDWSRPGAWALVAWLVVLSGLGLYAAVGRRDSGKPGA